MWALAAYDQAYKLDNLLSETELVSARHSVTKRYLPAVTQV